MIRQYTDIMREDGIYDRLDTLYEDIRVNASGIHVYELLNNIDDLREEEDVNRIMVLTGIIEGEATIMNAELDLDDATYDEICWVMRRIQRFCQ